MYLGRGHWPEPQDGGPPGQRFADRGDRQEVSGPREQEATRRRIIVHDRLNGADEPVPAELYLVDHQRMRLLAQEGEGVLQRGQPCLFVVESRVGTTPLRGDLLGEGGLAALPGTVQHHYPEGVQRFAEPRTKVAFHMPHDNNPTP